MMEIDGLGWSLIVTLGYLATSAASLVTNLILTVLLANRSGGRRRGQQPRLKPPSGTGRLSMWTLIAIGIAATPFAIGIAYTFGADPTPMSSDVPAPLSPDGMYLLLFTLVASTPCLGWSLVNLAWRRRLDRGL